MAENAPLAANRGQSKALCADSALHIAWGLWIALLAVPFVVFLAVIWYLTGFEDLTADSALARTWFIVSMCYMGLAIPAAFFWRGRMFRGYWSGQTVAPRDYLAGMLTIWLAIEIGGLIALLGCLMTATLLPNLLPALLAFMLFTPLWPNGHSMTRPLINEHDPADYEEPR